LLYVARNLRERTLVPLFNIWLPHNQSAQARVRAGMTPADYESSVRAARQIRDEAAATEARALLEQFAAG
jgi:hypothetical protein